MCGFAGEFLFGDGLANIGLAQAMARRLVHRGPDEEGAYASPDGRCTLGFRRLCVIDPSGSHQPMTSPGGSAAVAFNGEIYNFHDLRRDLQSSGAQFRTSGDTEVLLHLYTQGGTEMFGRLDGMFAVVLYDVAAKRLLLARDPLGEKPLWYAILPDRVVFASEAKSLLVHPLVPKDVRPESIISYLAFGYIPAPDSIWQGIRKLMPGSWMSFSGRAREERRYWQPAPAQVPSDRKVQIKLVRSSLQAAVQSRMVSDVPLGALLSGGIDSSIIVGLMSEAAGASGGVRTFTAGFEDSQFDERPFARQIAKHFGTKHTELLIPPAAAAEMLDQLIETYDEPFGDSSALPTMLICRAARQHVTVALAGDGGDEVFAGYDRYRAMHLASGMGPGKYLVARLVAMVLGPLAPKEEKSRLRRFVRFANALPYPAASQYFVYRNMFNSNDLQKLLSPDFAAANDIHAPSSWFCELYEEPEVDEEVTRAQMHDLMTYLPDDLLVKTDRASMAASLELRAPMLQKDLVGLGLGLPTQMKVDGRRGKAILREAFADMLPPWILDRLKQGFGVPLDRWLRKDLLEVMRETLLDKAFLSAGIFREESIAGLVNDHLSGRGDHRHCIWSLLVLARWMRKNWT